LPQASALSEEVDFLVKRDLALNNDQLCDMYSKWNNGERNGIPEFTLMNGAMLKARSTWNGRKIENEAH